MKHRVVSVGDRRNMNRWLDIACEAIDATVPVLNENDRQSLAVALARAADERGYVLTAQVK